MICATLVVNYRSPLIPSNKVAGLEIRKWFVTAYLLVYTKTIWKIDKYLFKTSQKVLYPLVTPGSRFFLNVAPCWNDSPYHNPKNQKIFMTSFRENVNQKWKWPLRFFSKILPCHFLIYMDPQLYARFQKKLISGLWDI